MCVPPIVSKPKMPAPAPVEKEAEIERENVSTRIKASKEVAKKERRYLGGYSEFGYKVEDNKLIPDDKEFVVLQSMIDLRKAGLGYRKISDEINKEAPEGIEVAEFDGLNINEEMS